MNNRLEITIIAVGKLKEDYLQDAEKSFVRELAKRWPLRVVEVKDEKTKDGASEKELQRVKNLEGKGIMKHLDPRARIIAMDISGKSVSTQEFQRILEACVDEGTKVQFIIGGSLGISDEVLSTAHQRISFGRMTYPHQLFRIMLLEEISRASVNI